MSNRDIGREILEGIKEVKRFKEKDVEELRSWILKEPSCAKTIRKLLKIKRPSIFSL